MTMKEIWALVNDLYYMHGMESVTIDINNGDVTLMATCRLDDEFPAGSVKDVA